MTLDCPLGNSRSSSRYSDRSARETVTYVNRNVKYVPRAARILLNFVIWNQNVLDYFQDDFTDDLNFDSTLSRVFG